MATCSKDTVVTGSSGTVTVDGVTIARLTQWSVNPTAAESAWGDSDSAGFTNRVAARKDATGSITGKFDSSNKVYDLFLPGDVVALTLKGGPAGDWVFPCALITSFNIAFNQDTKEVVEWSADFGADGTYTSPGTGA